MCSCQIVPLGVVFLWLWLMSLTTEAQSVFTLPKVEPFNETETMELESGKSIFVREFTISGNSVLPNRVLEKILQPYVNQFVTFLELSKLRDALTLAYVERGYINSGAMIPRQILNDGVIHIQIVEGVLSHIEIDNPGRLSEHYLRRRIAGSNMAGKEVINLKQLEEKLQILQQNPRIKSVQTHLLPGDYPGESVLNVKVVEEKPYHITIELSNYEAPSVGAERLKVNTNHNNLLGYGDVLNLGARKSEGLAAVDLRYEYPINARDAHLFIVAQQSNSEVIEAPFDTLKIESKSSSVSLGVHYPLYRSTFSQFDLFTSLDYRRS